jgi:hypothetical protein
MRKILRALVSAALFAGLTLLAPPAANAEEIYGPFEACPNFDVSLSFSGGNQGLRVTRVHDGVIYTVTSGSGTTITFYAVDKKGNILKSVTFDTKASVTKTATSGGNTTYQINGFGTLLLFPTDQPGGPSTTVYNGTVTFTFDATNTLVSTVLNKGRQFDICAALS